MTGTELNQWKAYKEMNPWKQHQGKAKSLLRQTQEETILVKNTYKVF